MTISTIEIVARLDEVILTRKNPLTAPAILAKKEQDFDPKTFLATIGEGRKVVSQHSTSLLSVDPENYSGGEFQINARGHVSPQQTRHR